MTTKTDITLPPLPVGFFKHHIAGFDGPVYAEMQMQTYARAAVEADRQSHVRDATKMVPSDLVAMTDAVLRDDGPSNCRMVTLYVDELMDFAHTLLSRYGSSQPIVSAEPVVRYCPGCGSIGPVSAGYANCCPDGNQARMIPRALAEKCHDIFMIAIKAMMAESANDPVAPVAQEPPRVVAWRTVNSDGRPMTDWIDGAPAQGERPAWRSSRFELAYAAPAAAHTAQNREDAQRMRNAAEILDTLTSKLVPDHPLRTEATRGAKRAVADLYRLADQTDAAQVQLSGNSVQLTGANDPPLAALDAARAAKEE